MENKIYKGKKTAALRCINRKAAVLVFILSVNIEAHVHQLADAGSIIGNVGVTVDGVL